MTADSALYIPPYKADDQDIVVELNSRFGAETFTVQPTRTGMPVLWVPRERLIEVLTFLRQVPKPYVMLYDLHGVDERLRDRREEALLRSARLKDLGELDPKRWCAR